jgi:hypothetical protein
MDEISVIAFSNSELIDPAENSGDPWLVCELETLYPTCGFMVFLQSLQEDALK